MVFHSKLDKHGLVTKDELFKPKVHLQLNKRSGKKFITIADGFVDIDLKKIGTDVDAPLLMIK